MTTYRITGGERGFRRAVHEALYGKGAKMLSPSVRWSRADGFIVKPAANLNPLHEGEIEIWRANFSANTGKPYGRPDYSEVRERIAGFEVGPWVNG